MYVAIAYVNDEVTPVQAVIDRLVRWGATYVAMPLSEEQQELVRQRMPVLVTVRAFYFEAEPTLIAEACEAEGLRAFYADWDVESAFEGLLSRYGVQLTSQAFETLGRAFSASGHVCGGLWSSCGCVLPRVQTPRLDQKGGLGTRQADTVPWSYRDRS